MSDGASVSPAALLLGHDHTGCLVRCILLVPAALPVTGPVLGRNRGIWDRAVAASAFVSLPADTCAAPRRASCAPSGAAASSRSCDSCLRARCSADASAAARTRGESCEPLPARPGE